MWNEDLYNDALEFSAKAHLGQTNPGTEIPYLMHIARVTMETLSVFVNTPSHGLDTDYAMLCALLHDTVEDTEVTVDQIEQRYGKKVAEGVSALTKNESLPTKIEQMKDSLQRIIELHYPEVRIVKMADRIVNLRRPPHYWKREKKEYYQQEARLILEKLGGVNDYVEGRLAKRIRDYQKYID